MRGALKKVVISTTTLVFALAATEVAARVASQKDFTAEAARADASRLIDRLTGNPWGPAAGEGGAPQTADEPQFRLHPYVGFDLGIAERLRAEELQRMDAVQQDEIDVLILGGSVAAQLGNECQQQIESALARDPAWTGRTVNVTSHGQGGFRQPQQIHLLLYLLSIGFEPEIVVELDGFNEVVLGAVNASQGVHPALPWIGNWAPVASHAPLSPEVLDQVDSARREQRASAALFERADSLGLFHSALASFFVQRSLEQSYGRYADAYDAYQEFLATPAVRTYCIGPPLTLSENDAIELSASIWAQCSLDMDALCRRRSIRYVHVLQPTLHDKGSKPLTEQERRRGAQPEEWARAARIGYPLLRKHGQGLAEQGLEFLDASQVFNKVEETLYQDVCHFSLEGNRLLANALLAQLQAKPPPPLAPGGH